VASRGAVDTAPYSIIPIFLSLLSIQRKQEHVFRLSPHGSSRSVMNSSGLRPSLIAKHSSRGAYTIHWVQATKELEYWGAGILECWNIGMLGGRGATRAARADGVAAVPPKYGRPNEPATPLSRFILSRRSIHPLSRTRANQQSSRIQ
jgi:hypothetical protein